MIAKVGPAVAELVADQLNVLRQAGKEQPAGAGVEGVGVLLQALRGIVFRIDTDGIKEDIAPDAVTELRGIRTDETRCGPKRHIPGGDLNAHDEAGEASEEMAGDKALIRRALR